MKRKYFHTITNSLFHYFRQLNNLRCTWRMKKEKLYVWTVPKEASFPNPLTAIMFSPQSPECVALFCFLSSPGALFKMSPPDNMNCARFKPFSGTTQRQKPVHLCLFSKPVIHSRCEQAQFVAALLWKLVRFLLEGCSPQTFSRFSFRELSKIVWQSSSTGSIIFQYVI